MRTYDLWPVCCFMNHLEFSVCELCYPNKPALHRLLPLLDGKFQVFLLLHYSFARSVSQREKNLWVAAINNRSFQSNKTNKTLMFLLISWRTCLCLSLLGFFLFCCFFNNKWLIHSSGFSHSHTCADTLQSCWSLY